MAHDLYDADFVLWTEDQAAALRARDAGLNRLDYDNLAEEVESLGASWTNQARSHVRNILRHLYKMAYSPAVNPRAHWRVEILNWRAELEDLLTGSIRNRLALEMSRLHTRALALARADCAAYGESLEVDEDHQWTLEQVLGEVDDPVPTLSS